MSDRTVGILGLLLSITYITFLFTKLVIIPILPLDEELQTQLLPPTYILTLSGIMGLHFIGGLCVYIMYVIYQSLNK